VPATLSVIVCNGPVCGDRRGSARLLEHAQARVAERGLADRVSVRTEVCLGHCLRGPNILVASGDPGLAAVGEAPGVSVLYNHMTIEDLDRVIERHLVGGIAVRALTNLPPIPIGSRPSKNRPR
jgi:(2Fe-2S) ferredoxin